MNKFQANLCLITATLCWSCELILLKNIPTNISGFAVTTMTNLIGCIILSTLFFKDLKANYNTKIMKDIALLAIINMAYNIMVIYALKYLDVTTGIFTASMAIIFIPIILVFCNKKLKLQVWLGALLILTGILNSIDLNFPQEQTIGLAFMILFAIIRAGYIIRLNDLSKHYNPLVISILILGYVACFSFIIWFFIDPGTFFSIEYSPQMLSSIFAHGYFICAFATVINIFAQTVVSATSAAAIYSLYPVFSIVLAAVLPAILIDSIPITTQVALNCFLISLGAFASEADWSLIKKHYQKIMS